MSLSEQVCNDVGSSRDAAPQRGEPSRSAALTCARAVSPSARVASRVASAAPSSLAVRVLSDNRVSTRRELLPALCPPVVVGSPHQTHACRRPQRPLSWRAARRSPHGVAAASPPRLSAPSVVAATHESPRVARLRRDSFASSLRESEAELFDIGSHQGHGCGEHSQRLSRPPRHAPLTLALLRSGGATAGVSVERARAGEAATATMIGGSGGIGGGGLVESDLPTDYGLMSPAALSRVRINVDSYGERNWVILLSRPRLVCPRRRRPLADRSRGAAAPLTCRATREAVISAALYGLAPNARPAPDAARVCEEPAPSPRLHCMYRAYTAAEASTRRWRRSRTPLRRSPPCSCRPAQSACSA